MIKETFSTHEKIDYFKIVMFGIAVIVITGCFLILWLIYLDDNPPIVINEVALIDSSVTAGDFMLYDIDFCKKTNHQAEIRTTWENEIVISQIPIRPVNDRECAIQRIKKKVPDHLNSGTYTVKFAMVYEPNPIVNRIVRFELGPVNVRGTE